MGKVEEYLLREIREQGCIHLTLIDPDKIDPKRAAEIARKAEDAGSMGIMVGGSLGVTERMLDETVLSIKKMCKLPVILFPGDVASISKHADAIWFLSVLNSSSTYHIIGAQVKGGVIVRRYGLEAISLAYLILGQGGVVSYVSQTRPLPLESPQLVKAYAIAAELMGFHFLYLEGGSGGKPIPPEVVREVRGAVKLPLIVGGGVRERRIAEELASAGADIIVTGNIVEEADNVGEVVKEIVEGLKSGAKLRRGNIEVR